MKKNIILIIVCLVLGIYMGYIMFNSYNKEEIKPVSISSKIEKFYFIQVGVYSSLEQMKQSLTNLEYYIYTKEKDLYYVYVGITKMEENRDKLKEYFNKLGYDIYVKELEIDNKNFNDVLSQYDNLLKETTEEKVIATVCNQVLNKYEELVINVESKGDSTE